MKTTMRLALLFLLVGGWVLSGPVRAGDLEPPGPPAATMVTLQQIYDGLDNLVQLGPGVPKTGQTSCWAEGGILIDCAGTGQDGAYQTGVSVSPRFTDNGDGTIKDNMTGLIWLQDANCFGQRTWFNALSDANALADGSCGLTDGSVPGDWRVPNVKELASLIDFGHIIPALPVGHLFSGVQSSLYWSSTTAEEDRNSSWSVDFYSGRGNLYGKLDPQYVWSVRGGR